MLRPFQFAGNNSIFLKPKIKVHQRAGGSCSCCAHMSYSWSSLFPCLSKLHVVCGSWLWRDLDMSLGCSITYLRLSPGLWGGGVWILAWKPLNISIPAIKYSMQWELESLQSLNYRSVLKCAFPPTEVVE